MRVVLAPAAPLDFALTALVLRRSDRNAVDVVDARGAWSRVADLGGGPTLVRARQDGARLLVEADPARDGATLRAFVTRLFGLDVDVAPFFARARREPAFAHLAARCAGLRPQRFPSLFEAFANGICCQQLSLAAGLTVLGRLAARLGSRVGARVGPPLAARVGAAPPSLLREAGLSTRRADFLQALARIDLDALARELDGLPDAEARRRLLALPGVGPWTADYVLLRGLGRLAVFPRGDVGAARALGRMVGRPVEPGEAPTVAARFGPLAGMLYFCMLGDALATGAPHPDRPATP